MKTRLYIMQFILEIILIFPAQFALLALGWAFWQVVAVGIGMLILVDIISFIKKEISDID